MSDAALLMDRIYRHQRVIYDVTRRYYLLGRDRMVADLRPSRGGSVLEIGCGTGRNLIHCAASYPQARLFGLDISAAMLETASNSLKKRGLDGKVKLAQADATTFNPDVIFGEALFERIFISYSLSMIPVWPAVVRRALQCLQPGGSLHIVDFGQQEGWPHWFRSLLFRWLSWFSVTPIANFREDLQKLTNEGSANLSFQSLYRGYAVLATLSAGQASSPV